MVFTSNEIQNLNKGPTLYDHREIVFELLCSRMNSGLVENYQIMYHGGRFRFSWK